MYNSTVYVCVCILVYIIVRYSRFEYVIVRDINKKNRVCNNTSIDRYYSV